MQAQFLRKRLQQHQYYHFHHIYVTVAHKKKYAFMIVAITILKYHLLNFVNCHMLLRLVTKFGKRVDESLQIFNSAC